VIDQTDLQNVETLSQIAAMDKNKLQSILKDASFNNRQITDVFNALSIIPLIEVKWNMPSSFTLATNTDEPQMAKVKVSLFRKSKVRDQASLLHSEANLL